MKIISWNVNGIRAAARKDFLTWFKKEKADIVCLQEAKAHLDQIPEELKKPVGYEAYFNLAQRRGYSGVVVYAKEKPKKVETKLGLRRFDEEGRMLRLEFSKFTLINFYIPFGGRSKENLPYKLNVYKRLLKYFAKEKNKKLLILGDFNIAHKEIDLARPKQNKNNIMFTPEERKQIDRLIELGFTDTFRKLHKGGGHYSWWSYFANARARNLGWRIDYVFTTKTLTPHLTDAFILNKVVGSDHCPVGVRIKNSNR